MHPLQYACECTLVALRTIDWFSFLCVREADAIHLHSLLPESARLPLPAPVPRDRNVQALKWQMGAIVSACVAGPYPINHKSHVTAALHHACVTHVEFALDPAERMLHDFLEPTLMRIADAVPNMGDVVARRVHEWLMALVVYDVIDPDD